MIILYVSATCIVFPLLETHSVCENKYQAAMTLRYTGSLSNQYAYPPRPKVGRKPKGSFWNLGQVGGNLWTSPKLRYIESSTVTYFEPPQRLTVEHSPSKQRPRSVNLTNVETLRRSLLICEDNTERISLKEDWFERYVVIVRLPRFAPFVCRQINRYLHLRFLCGYKPFLTSRDAR